MAIKTKLWLSLFAVGIGVSTILLFTTLVNDVFFKEVNFCISSSIDLATKSMGILLSGIFTGFLVSLIVVRTNHWPHIALSLFVLTKMAFVVECPFTGNPMWYDAMVNGLLISGLWLGLYAAHKFPLAPV